MKRRDAVPTMKDVAREAGVSLGTVSKVFNGIPVGERYRVRVEEAAARLGYQVNSYARGLKTNRTQMATLLLPDVVDPLYAALAEEVCKALSRRDFRMILALSHNDPDEEQRSVRLMEQHNVDGIIGLICNPELKISDRIPFVSIRDLDAGSGQCSVRDMPQLAEACVNLLLREDGGGAPAIVRIDSIGSGRGDDPKA